jgi:glutamyl-tRNA synthetase
MSAPSSPAGSGPVRVRFAPSPTGYLHIGGVRTALFNWLWARRTGGTFVLRIEDTDQERSTPENEAIILRDLAWLGLTWDEGPDVGGPHGPYRQMERLPLYHEHAERLIAKGAAYRCSCTKEELDAQREALKARDPKAQFRYPGTCRDRHVPAGTRSVVRMRAPEGGDIVYRDLVFGEVRTPASTLQDAVIMRSDGVPLYNLGAVVDDVTMGITLVARGRDHMINTPIQIVLYEALGVPRPQFAHLPMMLAPDGQKLSKRHGAVSVGEYRDQGIPPEGLLNYLVRFGWSFGDEEIFTLAELVQKFDWERCGRGDGKFDAKKLGAVAFEHLKSPARTSDQAYVAGVRPFLGARGLQPTDAEILAALPLYRERAQTFADAAHLMDYLFREPPALDDKARAKFLVPAKAELLDDMATVVTSSGDDPTKIEARVLEWSAARGLELKDFAQPARVALTGRTASPGLYEVMALLGTTRSAERLRRGAAIARGEMPSP